MGVAATILARLAALKLPGEAFQEVLAILAELQGADDARRERQRARQQVSRDKKRDGHAMVTSPSHENAVTSSPPHPLKKERKIPVSEPKGSDPGDQPTTQAELEKDLFKRGRQVCGKSSGGLVNALLKSRQFDVSLARSVIEMAATKHDPREFVAAAVRANGNVKNNPNSLLAAIDRFEERLKSGADCATGEDDFFRIPEG